MPTKRVKQKSDISDHTREVIREAVEPMTSAIEADYLKYCKTMIAELKTTLSKARADIRASFEKKKDGEDYVLPSWFDSSSLSYGIYPQITLDKAMTEIGKFFDPFHLACYKSGQKYGSGNAYRYVKILLEEQFRLTAIDKSGKLEKHAREEAESVVHNTVEKLARKISSLSIKSHMITGRSTDYFVLDLELRNGDNLTMRTERIVNTSSQGLRFYQWPTRLQLKGQAVSEKELAEYAR